MTSENHPYKEAGLESRAVTTEEAFAVARKRVIELRETKSVDDPELMEAIRTRNNLLNILDQQEVDMARTDSRIGRLARHLYEGTEFPHPDEHEFHDHSVSEEAEELLADGDVTVDLNNLEN